MTNEDLLAEKAAPAANDNIGDAAPQALPPAAPQTYAVTPGFRVDDQGVWECVHGVPQCD
jgi:hypothetical protein